MKGVNPLQKVVVVLVVVVVVVVPSFQGCPFLPPPISGAPHAGRTARSFVRDGDLVRSELQGRGGR